MNKYRLADLASLLGLFITVVGFGITIWNVRKSRKLSESIRDRIYHLDAIVELGFVVASLEEIKNLLRTSLHAQVPYRLGIVRNRLIAIRSQSPQLSEEDKSAIQSAITNFANLEKRLDISIQNKANQLAWARDNAVISNDQGRLSEMLGRLKSNGGSL